MAERSVLIVDAIHPEEPQMGEFYNQFQSTPIDGVGCTIGNYQGYTANPRSRFMHGENLTVLGAGDPNGTPAQRQVHKIIEMCKAYDLSIFLHGVQSEAAECAYISNGSSMFVRAVAAQLFDLAVIGNEENILNYAPQSMFFEINPSKGPQLCDVYDYVKSLAAGYTPIYHPLTTYRYAGDVTAELGIKNNLQPYYPPFTRLNDHDTAALLAAGIGDSNVLYSGSLWDSADALRRTEGQFWAEAMQKE